LSQELLLEELLKLRVLKSLGSILRGILRHDKRKSWKEGFVPYASPTFSSLRGEKGEAKTINTAEKHSRKGRQNRV